MNSSFRDTVKKAISDSCRYLRGGDAYLYGMQDVIPVSIIISRLFCQDGNRYYVIDKNSGFASEVDMFDVPDMLRMIYHESRQYIETLHLRYENIFKTQVKLLDTMQGDMRVWLDSKGIIFKLPTTPHDQCHPFCYCKSQRLTQRIMSTAKTSVDVERNEIKSNTLIWSASLPSEMSITARVGPPLRELLEAQYGNMTLVKYICNMLLNPTRQSYGPQLVYYGYPLIMKLVCALIPGRYDIKRAGTFAECKSIIRSRGRCRNLLKKSCLFDLRSIPNSEFVGKCILNGRISKSYRIKIFYGVIQIDKGCIDFLRCIPAFNILPGPDKGDDIDDEYIGHQDTLNEFKNIANESLLECEGECPQEVWDFRNKYGF